jgi:hypothetical protein
MRYFFHIYDGSKVFTDEVGESFSGPAKAIDQANILAAELRKAGEFCRSTRIVVTDENDQHIFECQPS